jgi:hypothetical protein
MKGKKRVKSYIQALAASDTKEEAKLKAGYAPSTSTSQIESSNTFQGFIHRLDEALPNYALINIYKEALRATKQTQTRKSEPDHYIRLMAAKEVSKLKGHYKWCENKPDKDAPIIVTWQERP